MQRILLLFVSVSLLSACSLSTHRKQAVDAQVEAHRSSLSTCPEDVTNRCAIPSPVLKLGTESQQNGQHHVSLIEHGEDALKIRLHLIRAARQSIDVQNFILRRDDTGELFLHELLEAARRGVKVRLLLDQLFSVSDLEYLVALTMAHVNFEIRFYNPTFSKAKMEKHDWLNAVACCFRRFNQRMHNKLMTVDGLAGITGGRNIADRYFDYDTNYAFKDRDVLVLGPELPYMTETFDWFWSDVKSVPVKYLRDVAEALEDHGPLELEPWAPRTRLLPLLEEVDDPQHIRDLFIVPSFEVVRLRFFSDRPRKQEFPPEASRGDITDELFGILQAAEHSVMIQSPYMVLSRRAREVFLDLKKKNPDMELVFSTNSLASTDADNVYANTHRHKDRYIKKIGFLMYEFKPFPEDAPQFFSRWPALIEEKSQGLSSQSVVSGDDSTIPMPAPRVGLHSKTFVVDGRVTMIGSHNFDPRSEGFNTENGLVVWDASFAQKVEELIRQDIHPRNSWVVAALPDREQEENGHRPGVGNHRGVFPLVQGRYLGVRTGAGQGSRAAHAPRFLRQLLRPGQLPAGGAYPPPGADRIPGLVLLFPRTHPLVHRLDVVVGVAVHQLVVGVDPHVFRRFIQR